MAKVMAPFVLVKIILFVLYMVQGSKGAQTNFREQIDTVYCVLSSRNDSSLCPPGAALNDLSGFMHDRTFNESFSSFIFMPGTHYLNASLVVESSSGLSLVGEATGEAATIACTRMWTIGLQFKNVSDVCLQSITFVNCTNVINWLDQEHSTLYYVFSALYFQGGHNFRFSRLRFLNGAFFMDNTRGEIGISKVSVESYIYTITNGSKESMGGSYLNFSSAIYDYVNLTITESNFTFHNTEEIDVPFNQSLVNVVDRLQAFRLIVYSTNVQVKISKSLFSGLQRIR